MSRHRRISRTLAAALTAPALLLGSAAMGTPPAAATTVPGASVAAAEWRFVGNYAVHSFCAAAGAAGVQNGDWADYLCLPRHVGLDIRYYSLYVTP